MRSLLLVLLLLLLPGAAASAFDPFGEAGIDRKPGARVPMDLAFRDEAGRWTTLGALAAGRPLLLVPVLHACPNICGVTLSGLAQAVDAQPLRPGADFTLVAFGIDPGEGTTEAAKSLADLAGRFPDLAKRGGLHAVTGSPEAVRAVTDALGYRYRYDRRIGQYAHVAAAAALTADGRLARWLYGLAPEPTDLRLALLEAGEGKVGGWSEQLLLLCYRYDPVTGRYGPLVWKMLRVGGGATVLALGGFILATLRAERRPRRRRAS